MALEVFEAIASHRSLSAPSSGPETFEKIFTWAEDFMDKFMDLFVARGMDVSKRFREIVLRDTAHSA